MGLKNQIYDYLKNRPGVWINGSEVEGRALAIGRKASNASRRLRELAKEGRNIQRRINGKSVEYRYHYEVKVVPQNTGLGLTINTK